MDQIAVRMVCSIATRAFLPPRRGARRLYLTARKVSWVAAIDSAAVPRAALRYGLPGRVVVDLTRPADSLLPGHTPAQEARCFGLGNTVMSAPVSATTTSAVCCPTPGMEQIRSQNARNGVIARSIRWLSSSI